MAVREKYAHLSPLPPDIARRLEQLPTLMARASVQVAYLFGSACDCPENSADVDLAIVPARGYSYQRLYSRLSRVLGTDRIEVIELPGAPSWLQHEVLHRGRRIYARDAVWVSRYEAGLLALIEETRARWRAHAPALLRGKPMEVDNEFLQQLVVQLRRVADELERYKAIREDDLAANLSLRWAVEHGLQSGLTLILQAASHILARGFGVLLETYEASLAELRAREVISASLYRRLRGAGGFWSVLVHEYLQIDLSRVARFAKRAPGVFRAFAEELASWLGNR